MGGTVEVTMPIRQAMLLVFAVGVMAGSAGGMFLITMGAVPTGAVTVDMAAGTTDSSDDGDDPAAPAEPQNDSEPSAVEENDSIVDVSNLTFDDDPVLGDADAPVTIVEFSDYQCPYCRRFAQDTLPQLRENEITDGTVRFVYKDFPLRQYHPKAEPMARAATCAGDQDSYWTLHDKLFDAQQNISGPRTARFDADKIPQWASEVGLDMDRFTQCYNSSQYKVDVEDDFQQGRAMDVSSTPTFIVYRTGSDTGTTVVGSHPYSKFQDVINATLNDR
jgi:protein-disulfide isomerase